MKTRDILKLEKPASIFSSTRPFLDFYDVYYLYFSSKIKLIITHSKETDEVVSYYWDKMKDGLTT